MRSNWTVVVAVMTVMLTVGCGDTSEQTDTPEPETVEVPVTIERTVEVTAPPNPDSEPTTTDSGPTAQSGADITCEIGQECDLGESSITVTNAEQAQGINAMGETLDLFVPFTHVHLSVPHMQPIGG